MERLKRCYALLGLPPGASSEQVKQAYADAEKGLHADRFADDPLVRRMAQQRLSAINKAYLAIIDADAGVQASRRDHGNKGRPAFGEPEMPASDEVSVIGSETEGMPTSAWTVAGIDSGGHNDVESSVEGNGLTTSSSDAATGGSPDPVALLKKEIWLLFAVLAAFFIILLVYRCKPVKTSTAPPASPGKTQTPGESAPVGRDVNSDRPISPSPLQEKLDIARIRHDAEQGNAKAQALLGYCYAEGTGAGKDPAEAAKWFGRAADQGNAAAQDWLGYLHETGQGVAKDYGKAVKWYQLAAGQGDADAQKNLGLMYFKGKGVAKNRQEALKWLRKAAAQGNGEAQKALAALQGE